MVDNRGIVLLLESIIEQTNRRNTGSITRIQLVQDLETIEETAKIILELLNEKPVKK